MSLDAPHLFALSPYRPSGLHQGLAFLPKNVVDVKNVEFARAYRLTNNTIGMAIFEGGQLLAMLLASKTGGEE